MYREKLHSYEITGPEPLCPLFPKLLTYVVKVFACTHVVHVKPQMEQLCNRLQDIIYLRLLSTSLQLPTY